MKKFMLSIPEPCHENWEDMAPVEKGRFCAACHKTVIDFTQMSDTQIATYFKKVAASTCGMLTLEQVNREILVPKRKLPWVRYFFQISLPAFLFSVKTYSQKQSVTTENVSTKKSAVKRQDSLCEMIFRKINGQVKDSIGTPIPFATISIKNSTKSVASDENGFFEIDAGTDEVAIVISAIGYETVENVIRGNNPISILMNRKSIQMEPVVVTSFVDFRKTSYAGSITRISGEILNKAAEPKFFPAISRLLDTVFSNISIYPNPVTANSVIKIKTTKVEEGVYLASIFDAKGAVVQISSVSHKEKNVEASLPLGNISAGNYVLCLRNKSTGKQYTKKLVVQ